MTVKRHAYKQREYDRILINPTAMYWFGPAMVGVGVTLYRTIPTPVLNRYNIDNKLN